jgi:hypothetical protein
MKWRRRKMNQLNYGTLEACQRLAKAGIVIETKWVWILSAIGWEIVDNIKYFGIWKDAVRFPAPSMAEVWRELPDHLDSPLSDLVVTKDSMGITTCFYKLGHEYESVNPTDALIDLLIWLEGRKEK